MKKLYYYCQNVNFNAFWPLQTLYLLNFYPRQNVLTPNVLQPHIILPQNVPEHTILRQQTYNLYIFMTCRIKIDLDDI
jgi:hypothetical protein